MTTQPGPTPRALHRFELAGRLMAPAVDAAAARQAIDAMTPDAREHLRALVDWVEAYEAHEANNCGPSAGSSLRV